MHAPSKDKPTQAQLLLPMLETVVERGGTARAKDVASDLADRFGLKPELREETVVTGDGQVVNVWQRHVRFGFQKVKKLGYLRAEKHGQWAVTDEGREATVTTRPHVTIRVFTTPDGAPFSAEIELDLAFPTLHTIRHGNARDLSWLPANSVQLVVTSPPYFDVKQYDDVHGQLGNMDDYFAFLDMLDGVWKECLRVLQPGCKMVVNVGDVVKSRKEAGRHFMYPLHADIMVRGRNMGFMNLNGITWEKIGNVTREQKGGGAFLGKPYQPNPVLKLDHEHILLFQKPGPYRATTPEQREQSRLTKDEVDRWVRSRWSDVPGASTRGGHPAPFSAELPYRLIRLFSFAGDTVLDTFGGEMNTVLGAMRAGRNSIALDISRNYVSLGIDNVRREAARLTA